MDRSSKGTAFIQWAEEVPADWSSVRLRNLLTSVLAGNWGYDPGSSDIDLLCARIADFDWNRLEIRDENIHTRRSYTHDQAKRFVLESGDLLVEKSGGGEKHPVGRCVQYQGEGGPAFANFAMRLRVNESVSSGFLCYSLAASYYRGHSWKILNQTTGIQNLDVSAFRSSPIPLPPRAEQRAIVDFLDAKAAEIDGLVGKLVRQVELLERYRRELIAHTVTRGLDPDAPMKDSGIEWVGEIPDSWKTVSLSAITDENRRKNTDLAEKNLLSLSYGEIIRKDTDLPFGLLPASFDGYQVVDSGYIILRMTDLQNDKRSLRTGLAHERGIITGAYIGLIPRGAVISGYLAWLLRFYDLAKVFYSLGGGVRQSANYKEVGKLSVLLPPIEEQQQIAEYLDQKNAEIDSTIAGIRKQIELLGKYRKQVINDAVTGKVRVGEVA